MIQSTLNSTNVLGMMSGSSMDGLDLALVKFHHSESWQLELLDATTMTFTSETEALLAKAYSGTAHDLAMAHSRLGSRFAEMALDFLRDAEEGADLISSHGHTIFHRPDLNMTFQAGSGAEIAALTGIDTVCDLRTTDVALNGQGAPLVPAGERALFPEHKIFLNLGGIANISIHGSSIQAFDICPCNQILNSLAAEMGEPFDRNGDMARSGNLNDALLPQLLKQMSIEERGKNSLGREYFDEKIQPILSGSSIPTEDKLNTAVEAIAVSIRGSLDDHERSIFTTGGGALNAFLVERLNAHCNDRIHLPDRSMIDFKEAIIFAFLGLLRVRNEVNCLSEVTGANYDNIGGALYPGNSKHDS